MRAYGITAWVYSATSHLYLHQLLHIAPHDVASRGAITRHSCLIASLRGAVSYTAPHLLWSLSTTTPDHRLELLVVIFVLKDIKERAQG